MTEDAVLITGAAGFIGFCLTRRLLEGGRAVVGVDNVNSYYDPTLKEARLAVLRQFENFTFHRLDLADRRFTASLFGDGVVRAECFAGDWTAASSCPSRRIPVIGDNATL